MHHIELGPYKNLTLPPIDELSEQNLELAVQRAMLKQMKLWAKYHRPVTAGDEISVSLMAVCEGSFIPELSVSSRKFTVGDPEIIDPFRTVSGKKMGDEFNLEFLCPDDFFVDRIQGKTIDFLVRVVDVIHHQPLPAPSDEIARQIDPSAANLDGLLARLRQTITENWLDILQEERSSHIMAAILEHSRYSLDEEEFYQVYCDVLRENRQARIKSGDIEALMEETEEVLMQKSRFQTEKLILERLVLETVACLENIALNPEEIRSGRCALLEFAGDEEKLNQVFPTEEALHKHLLKEKTWQVLLALNEQ